MNVKIRAAIVAIALGCLTTATYAQVANDADGLYDSTSLVDTNTNTTSNSTVNSTNTNNNNTTINSTNANTNLSLIHI